MSLGTAWRREEEVTTWSPVHEARRGAARLGEYRSSKRRGEALQRQEQRHVHKFQRAREVTLTVRFSIDLRLRTPDNPSQPDLRQQNRRLEKSRPPQVLRDTTPGLARRHILHRQLVQPPRVAHEDVQAGVHVVSLANRHLQR